MFPRPRVCVLDHLFHFAGRYSLDWASFLIYGDRRKLRFLLPLPLPIPIQYWISRSTISDIKVFNIGYQGLQYRISRSTISEIKVYNIGYQGLRHQGIHYPIFSPYFKRSDIGNRRILTFPWPTFSHECESNRYNIINVNPPSPRTRLSV